MTTLWIIDPFYLRSKFSNVADRDRRTYGVRLPVGQSEVQESCWGIPVVSSTLNRHSHYLPIMRFLNLFTRIIKSECNSCFWCYRLDFTARNDLKVKYSRRVWLIEVVKLALFGFWDWLLLSLLLQNCIMRYFIFMFISPFKCFYFYR